MMKQLLTSLTLSLLILIQPAASHAKSTVHSASWYGGYFHGRRTASGETYNKYAMTAASNSHKLGTKLKVTNIKNGKSVIVKVNDTGNFSRLGRTLDLSQGAFAKIAPLDQGLVNVTIQVIK